MTHTIYRSNVGYSGTLVGQHNSFTIGSYIGLIGRLGMKYTLIVNDPKTGWSHAKDVSVAGLAEATDKAKELKKGCRRLQFGLRCEKSSKGKQFMFVGDQFLGISDNQPCWLWLTGFGVKA